MERKTLDQRAQMTDLQGLRHSATHVMANVMPWRDLSIFLGRIGAPRANCIDLQA